MHGTHTIPSLEDVPGGHSRAPVRSAFGSDPASTAVQYEAPSCETLPSPQGVQVAAPATDEVPAGQKRAAVWFAFGTEPASTATQYEAPGALDVLPSAQSLQPEADPT